MNLTDFLSEERATLQPQPPLRIILVIVDGLNFNQNRPTEKNLSFRRGLFNSEHILKLLHSRRWPANSPTANKNKRNIKKFDKIKKILYNIINLLRKYYLMYSFLYKLNSFLKLIFDFLLVIYFYLT